MLTEKDNAWLEKRQESRLRYGWRYCRHCEFLSEDYDHWTGYCKMLDCPMIDFADYKDAAAFEARVARRLASVRLLPCAGRGGECIEPSIPSLTCEDCTLKHARLVVEREMEDSNE